MTTFKLQPGETARDQDIGKTVTEQVSVGVQNFSEVTEKIDTSNHLTSEGNLEIKKLRITEEHILGHELEYTDE